MLILYRNSIMSLEGKVIWTLASKAAIVVLNPVVKASQAEVGMLINLKGIQLGTFRRPVQFSHQIQAMVDQIVFHVYLTVIEFALIMAISDTMLDIDPSIDLYHLQVEKDLRFIGVV